MLTDVLTKRRMRTGTLNLAQGDRIQVVYADNAPPTNVKCDYVVPSIASVTFVY